MLFKSFFSFIVTWVKQYARDRFWATRGFVLALFARVGRYVDGNLEAGALYLLGHPRKVIIVDAALSAAAFLLGLGSWAFWAHILLLQNWAFTFVSRARNSASLSRHLRAGFLSNFVWWVSQVIIFKKLWHYIQGKNGSLVAVAVGLYYTLFTLTGSLLAHAQSLKTERGKGAVGASKRYAQIPVEEWERVQKIVMILGKEGKI